MLTCPSEECSLLHSVKARLALSLSSTHHRSLALAGGQPVAGENKGTAGEAQHHWGCSRPRAYAGSRDGQGPGQQGAGLSRDRPGKQLIAQLFSQTRMISIIRCSNLRADARMQILPLRCTSLVWQSNAIQRVLWAGLQRSGSNSGDWQKA